MSADAIIFPLFARDGFVNPTPWPKPSHVLPHEKYGPAVMDQVTGLWHIKQGPAFDGGWRWFQSDLGTDFITIYNKLFDPRAYADITDEEITDTPNGAEFVLYCAKVRCLAEHNFYAAAEAVRRALSVYVRRVRAEVRADLEGLAG